MTITYQIEKIARRKHDDGALLSRYKVTQLHDGALVPGALTAVYESEHKPGQYDGVDEIEYGRLISELGAVVVRDTRRRDRHERYSPREGLMSVVKQLTRVEGDDVIFPQHLGLKCFDHPGFDLAAASPGARGATNYYLAQGRVAGTFTTHDNKFFMMMPWGGEYDWHHHLKALDRLGAEQRITSTDFLTAFIKLIRKVEALQRQLRRPLGDIKDKNIMPVFNEAGRLVDFELIDVDGAFSEAARSFTPKFLMQEDFEEGLRRGLNRPYLSFETDYHNLAALCAYSADKGTREGYLRARFESITPAVVLPTGDLKTMHESEADPRPLRLSIIVGDPVGVGSEISMEDTIESRAMRWMFVTLRAGQSPLVSPEVGMSPLELFEHNEQMKQKLVVDCRHLLSFVADKAAVAMGCLPVGGGEDALDLDQRLSELKPLLPASFREYTALEVRDGLSLLMLSLNEMQIEMQQSEKEDKPTAYGDTALVARLEKMQALMEPWSGLVEYEAYVRENQLFVDSATAGATAATEGVSVSDVVAGGLRGLFS